MINNYQYEKYIYIHNCVIYTQKDKEGNLINYLDQ